MTTLTDGAELRPARRGDETGILACIQALADYEREPDAVDNTAEMIAATLFGDDPRAFAFVVDGGEGEIRAIAIWFLTYSTWTGRHGIWLEDLYVHERFRSNGYGVALLSALAGSASTRATRDWSGPCWTGTSRRSGSTAPSAPTRWTSGPRAGSPARP